MRKAHAIAGRVALIYAAAAGAWILLSGWLAISLPKPLEGQVEIAKGLLFVAVTALILYYVIHRWAHAYALEVRHAEGAERVLRQVVDTVPLGVVLTNDEGEITFLNPAAAGMLQVDARTCIGTSLETMFGTEDRSGTVEIGELLRTGTAESLTITPLGSVQPKDVFARAAQVDPGVPGSGWVVALSDITDTHREWRRYERLSRGYRVISEVATAVARAHDERQLLSQLCEQAVELGGFRAAWATALNAETGHHEPVAMIGLGERARAAADAMASSLGHAASPMPTELAEREVYVSNDLAADRSHPWSIAAASEGFGSSGAFAAGGPNSITASVTFLAAGAGYFDQDQVTLLKLLRDEVSFAMERIGLDRKRLEAEEALERSEATYRGMFEDHPQPMLVIDRETRRYLAANDAATNKYGYTLEEFKGMSMFDLRPTGDRARLERSFGEHLGPAFEDAGVWTHRDKSGREFPVQIWVHTVNWFGRSADLVMVEEIATVH